MSKLLLKNLKLEGKELVISTYFEKTKYLDISKIKLGINIENVCTNNPIPQKKAVKKFSILK